MKFLQKLASLRHLAIVGSLAGASTGLLWSVLVTLFSLDKMFDGTELIISLAVPGIISVLAWKIGRIRLWIVGLISYLTLLIPLFGVGIGGGNILQMTIAGTIGGVFWVVPIILSYFTRGLLQDLDEVSLRQSGRVR